MAYVSVGEINRATDPDSPAGHQIAEFHRNPQPWPPEFIISQITTPLVAAKDQGFILDGMPRKSDEIPPLLDCLTEHDISLDLILHLDTNPEECMRRLALRQQALGQTAV